MNREIKRLLRLARVWEEVTNLPGDCFRAVALWKWLKEKYPELNDIE